jgi:phosphatidylserine/phosphatidylglycerophosphate/cardiolipin synthase-like enzyme
VVIDADAEDPDRALVWTGSTNWSVDQLNGPDENNVIILRDQALARAYKIEFEEMFGSSGAQPNAANSKFGPEKTDNTPHEFNIGGRRVRAYFSPSDGTNAQIIGVINSANADLAFASMIITRNDIANAISTRIIQGVTEVYGITEDSAASQPAPQIWRQLKDALWFDRMTSNNGFSGIMHHKFVLADATASGSDPQLLTGSHNWSNNAELRNDENTLIVHDADIVNQFYQAFSWMFKRYTGRNVSISKGSMPESNWQVFPNPAGAQLFILVPETASTVVSLRLTDLNGRVIKTKQQAATLQPVEFPLEGIADGVYFLVADTQTKKAVFRIVVSP